MGRPHAARVDHLVMVIDMNEAQVRTVEQVRQGLLGTQALEFRAAQDDTGRYAWIGAVLQRLNYRTLRRCDRGVVLVYLQRLSGYSRAQVTRLVSRWMSGQQTLAKRYRAPAHAFQRRSTPADVALLAEGDRAMGTLSVPATACALRRQRDVFDDTRFERLGSLSVGHLYNPQPPVPVRHRSARSEEARSHQAGVPARRRDDIKQRDLVAELLDERLRGIPEAVRFKERWEAEGMGPVHQEPGERAGRRAGLHLHLDHLRQTEGFERGAPELRADQPAGRLASAERAVHPRTQGGGRLHLDAAREHRHRRQDAGGHACASALPRVRQPRRDPGGRTGRGATAVRVRCGGDGRAARQGLRGRVAVGRGGLSDRSGRQAPDEPRGLSRGHRMRRPGLPLGCFRPRP